jgi:glycosyltransferase involved in cell wall biosynthesis
MIDQITPLILTYNEAPNIGRTLEQLTWARDIIVVDSFSDDETVELAQAFPQVRVLQRKFDSHEQQWNFGLKETGITTRWVLALDADYVVSDELVEELKSLRPAPETTAYRANFIYVVNGKRLRSGIYPPVTVLYRREFSQYEQDGHTQKVLVTGAIENLRAPMLHDDRKSLSRWFQSQSRYTRLEAEKLRSTATSELGWKDRMRQWRVVAPSAMIFYCLIWRAGVLDGWAGFYYAFQRATAELMLSLHLIEQLLRSSGNAQQESVGNQIAQSGRGQANKIGSRQSDPERAPAGLD